MLLALDTATRLASIALYDGQRLLSEASWHSAQQHTVELMPRLVDMLEQAGVTPTMLSAVAVALGPGSFTGLRVALSVAKGLAVAHDLALLGVPTLDVVAYPHRGQPLPVCAVVQAGRGRLCWAMYGGQQSGWQSQGEYRLSPIEEVVAAVKATGRETLFAGEIGAGTAVVLQEALGERARLASPALSLRRAGYLAELAWTRYQRGERDDPVSLSPIYLHEPAIKAGRQGYKLPDVAVRQEHIRGESDRVADPPIY
ncbi:MAG: tRNA (adenosine(37)-N6)-threonylcarbamoyltransferase complex dimerization subunit type 1 TsaB [Anaerolineae bacterium]|nr:tRNA (adenosine(37)-N6)-threonylcarbamoyltransferase complex dimerization subunit type 1 TsaB [Anaerolineae bacterium]